MTMGMKIKVRRVRMEPFLLRLVGLARREGYGLRVKPMMICM
jgi:hypothetical protein